MTIYKACDIRGKYGAELTLNHSIRLGYALRIVRKSRKILVGGDGRLSTPVLKEALIESLLRNGFEVTDLGIIPTPAFYYARRRLGIDTGVMVTASHNPAEDNGFKLTLGKLPVTTTEMKNLERLMEQDDASVEEDTRGTYRKLDLLQEYVHSLAPHIPDLSGIKVVIDCANGMAGLVARQVWEQTDADCFFILEEINGRFPVHPPNPAEARNLVTLQTKVRTLGADLGVAYDGDADRVVFVDEMGQPVTGDQAIVIFIREALKNGPETIVYDQKCSRIVADAIRGLGGNPVMELSGHTFIKRAFIQENAAYAGELSGHHFFKTVDGDDALAASLFFTDILKNSCTSLSQLTRSIPFYPITPDLRIPMPADDIQQLLDILETELGREAVIQRNDGLRIEFADGWGLVRPSVTEPVVTLRFEAINEDALKRIMNRVVEISPGLRGRIQV